MVEEYGMHRVRHGDVNDDLSELYQTDLADIFYSDPPWGEGNLRYWQTMNRKMNGEDVNDVNLESFLNRIFDVAVRYTRDDGIIFIEYGCRFNRHLCDMAKEHGLVKIAEVEELYRSGSRMLPLVLDVFDKNGSHILPDGYLESIYHKSGYNAVETALEPFAVDGGIITDPCCGMGYTAKFAVEHGMMFIGNELNRKRLDKTVNRLKRSNL